MQFVKIAADTTLSKLSEIVGKQNLETILSVNSVPRVPKVGQAIADAAKQAIDEAKDVTQKRKLDTLNGMTQDLDIFETASLMGSSSWKVFDTLNTFPNMLRVPESVQIASSVDTLGNGIRVPNSLYKDVAASITNPPHLVSPELFNEYSNKKTSRLLDVSTTAHSNFFQFFKIPWGEVSLYSSLSDSSMDFPVYPEEISDSVKASYTQMPEIMYQYEPWMLYTSSGPRTNTYTFKFHRDMWTGDHGDGQANELIRFCMANCYPEYDGSAVHSSLVTLYVGGKAIIRGVMNDVSVSWDGPLGSRDNFYLNCRLELNITEVSEQPLNYWTMMQKPLIG